MVWDTNTLTTNAAQCVARQGNRFVFAQEFRNNNMDGTTPIDSVLMFPGGVIVGGTYAVALTGDTVGAVCTFSLIPRTNNAVEAPAIASLPLTVPASGNIGGVSSVFSSVVGGTNGALCFPLLPGHNLFARAVSNNAASNGNFTFYLCCMVDRL